MSLGSNFYIELIKRLLIHAHGVKVQHFFGDRYRLYICPQAKVEILAALNDISHGLLCLGHEWCPWNVKFRFRFNRIVYKFIDSLIQIDWVERSFDTLSVYITRHPLSQSSSSIRLNWSNRYQSYLNSPRFAERFLARSIYDHCAGIDRARPLVERYVPSWCREDVRLFRDLDTKRALGNISYKELINDRDKVISSLPTAYDLTDVHAMQRFCGLPSSSTHTYSTAEARAAIRWKDTDGLPSRWQKDLEPDKERRALKNLKLLKIDRYLPGEDRSRRSAGLAKTRCAVDACLGDGKEQVFYESPDDVPIDF